jgi:NAD(P)-dependent dehydrogenase (short-subunit alcohol dehydrogenase family)
MAASLDRWERLDPWQCRHQRHGALETLSFESWKLVLDVNLNGTFHCLQVAAQQMLERVA